MQALIIIASFAPEMMRAADRCRPMKRWTAPSQGTGIAEVAPLMGLRGVRKAFGAVQALNGIDLDIRPGEIHAIVGGTAPESRR